MAVPEQFMWVRAIDLAEGDWVVLEPGEEPVRVGRVVWSPPDSARGPVERVVAELPGTGEVVSWPPGDRVRRVQPPACPDPI